MHWKFPLNAMLCPRLSFCPDLFFLRFSRMAGNAVRAGGGSSEPEPNFTTLTSHNDRRKQSLSEREQTQPPPFTFLSCPFHHDNEQVVQRGASTRWVTSSSSVVLSKFRPESRLSVVVSRRSGLVVMLGVLWVQSFYERVTSRCGVQPFRGRQVYLVYLANCNEPSSGLVHESSAEQFRMMVHPQEHNGLVWTNRWRG